MVFYLGTHRPNWLAQLDVPLMVSHRVLAGRRRLPRARAPWVLDSGGFTELALHGRWQVTPADYVMAVRRYAEQIGLMAWASPQDWMCEPFMLARTCLTVAEHQARTVGNYLELRALAPELPFIPVLQGWTLADYQACLARYERAGVDLTTVPLVGLGSVCRRQHTAQIHAVIRALADAGLRLHGFGVKTKGLAAYADGLESADSLAWSLRARRSPALPGCRTHRNCANCARYALRWRANVLRELDRPRQQRLRWEARSEAGKQVGRADGAPSEAEGAS